MLFAKYSVHIIDSSRFISMFYRNIYGFRAFFRMRTCRAPQQLRVTTAPAHRLVAGNVTYAARNDEFAASTGPGSTATY